MYPPKETEKEIRDVRDISERTVTKELEFKLTQAEIAERGQHAAKAAAELGELEREFEQVKKIHKGRIETKQGEMESVLRTIRAGVEQRTVECTERRDYQAHTVSYIFNGKVMHQRPLEMHERQMELVPKDKAAQGRDKAQETQAHV